MGKQGGALGCVASSLALAAVLSASPALGSADAGTAIEAAQTVDELDLASLLDQDLRTLTVTAVSKRAEKLGEAPASVTVLTREDFIRHGWRNVAEALR